MNRSELVAHMAKEATISQAAASRALNAVVGAVRRRLLLGGGVYIAGFGSFYVTRRNARMGRHPRTGAPMKIKAAKVARFKAYKRLRDAIN